jgi:exopolyphosphatase/guanosine-5'-triphosphate,3'-diphosphate pyrophosphatase
MKTKRLGAIDIGSSSVRLLINDVIDYNNEPFFKKDIMVRIPLRLGEDTFSNGFISDVKKEKLALLLLSFKGLLEVNDVDRWRVCATSALREASNRDEVTNYVFLKTGIEIHIIDTKEEARYILLNNMGRNFDDQKAYLFTDVGGGSTDMVLFHQQKEVAHQSFKLGTIRTLNKEVESEEWELLKGWINDHCRQFAKIVMIGSGGNINKVDSLLRRRGRIKREELIAFSNKMRSMSVEERVMNYNMNLNRATEIVPAIQIYLKVMKAARALAVETPIIGVADGIIRDLYLKRPHQDNSVFQTVEHK